MLAQRRVHVHPETENIVHACSPTQAPLKHTQASEGVGVIPSKYRGGMFVYQFAQVLFPLI